jgi:hypothetical protein
VLLVRTAGHDRHPEASPDGRWLAFTSEEAGRAEVFLQPLNGAGARRRISRDGGSSPRWSGDSRRLYWRSAGAIVSVDLDPAGVPTSAPVPRASGRFVGNAPYTAYAVGRDGRVLVSRLKPLRRVNTVNVILNLDVEIERLLTEAEAKR